MPMFNRFYNLGCFTPTFIADNVITIKSSILFSCRAYYSIYNLSIGS